MCNVFKNLQITKKDPFKLPLYNVAIFNDYMSVKVR